MDAEKNSKGVEKVKIDEKKWKKRKEEMEWVKFSCFPLWDARTNKISFELKGTLWRSRIPSHCINYIKSCVYIYICCDITIFSKFFSKLLATYFSWVSGRILLKFSDFILLLPIYILQLFMQISKNTHV